LYRRDDGSAGGPGQGDAAPPVQEYEDENQSEQEDNEDEVEEAEEKDDDDESEEKEEILDDAPVVVEEKKSKYSVKTKTKSAKATKPLKTKKKVKDHSEEVAEEDTEREADDAEGEEKPRRPPPMPAVLKHEMMNSDYDAQVNGVQHPGSQYPGAGAQYPGAAGQYPGAGNAPLLSRMTSYISSLLGRGGIGSDPIYMNRNAKSISLENLNAEDLKVLSRTKRQMKLADFQTQPFYHVRNNIRTMVRSQPNTKLSPQPVDDFSSLSEKASKPIKLFMEPYSAPTTYQNPPINPAQAVRGPSSSGVGTNPGGLGSSGLGQTQKASTSSNGGGKQGASGGNKKNNNNKQSGNKGKDKDKESEEDSGSDENNSEQQYPNYGEEEEDESSNIIPSGEDYEDTAPDSSEIEDDDNGVDEYEAYEE